MWGSSGIPLAALPLAALLGNLAGYVVGRRRHGLVPASMRRGGRFAGHIERALPLIERRGGWAVDGFSRGCRDLWGTEG
ncbi:hypothetical protein ABZX40_17320 [Streptomyces sp. NPDC004610]|uniref:hypothetical protein n=1 Tax=unclassified Streptomyces TaxID=2593676 RepID=UPI0033AEFF9E